MNQPINDKQKWQNILQRQRLANAEQWLKLLQKRDPSSDIIAKEYDNLLRALELVLQSPDTFDLASSLINVLYPETFGFADWDRWLVYLDQAQTMSQQLNRANEQANLTARIGELHYFRGDLEAAVHHYTKAQEIYKRVDNVAKQAYVMAEIALVYEAKDQEGLPLCQQALELAKQTADTEVIAHIQMNMSQIFIRMHNWEAGEQAAEQAYGLYQERNEPLKAVRAYFNMITCWEKLGRWAETELATTELLDVLVKMKDIHTLAKLKNNLGVLAYSQGKWEMAEHNWQEALQLQSQLQNPTERAFLFNNLGLVYTQMGELSTAKEMLQQAISIQNDLGNTYYWANAVDSLVDVHLMLNETAVACQLLRQAITRLTPIDAPHARKLLADMQAKLQV